MIMPENKTPNELALEAEIASLRESLRMQGELIASSTRTFTRAIAERDQRLQALTAIRPMQLKLAAKEVGV
jgi:hypothetical protein